MTFLTSHATWKKHRTSASQCLLAVMARPSLVCLAKIYAETEALPSYCFKVRFSNYLFIHFISSYVFIKDMASGRLPVRWHVPKQSHNAVVGACVYWTRTTPSYISTPLTVIHFISSHVLTKHMASGRLSMQWPVPKLSCNAVVGVYVQSTRTTPSYFSTPKLVRGERHVRLLRHVQRDQICCLIFAYSFK